LLRRGFRRALLRENTKERKHHLAMPLRNDRRVCLNHPEEDLVPLQETGTFHIVPLAKLRQEGGYEGLPRATGVLVFACRICGYCETYLTEKEIDLLKTIDFSS